MSIILAGSISALAESSPVYADPLDTTSLVEDGSYPDAAAILATQNVRLIAGDGHIVLADCATPPVGDIGLLKVYTTDETIGADGIGRVCFKLDAAIGRLDLEVPGVYEIRGDGQRTGTGHAVTAELTTDAGDELTVDVDPDGSTQVGQGADPNASPTTLLQLRAGTGASPVTGASVNIGKLITGNLRCTATLVDSQWVLTTAGCLSTSAGPPPQPAQVVFPGHAPIAITQVAPRADRDLALGKLTSSVTDVIPARLAGDAPAAGATVQAIGFGRTGTDWSGDAQSTATLTVTEVASTTVTATTTAGQVCKGSAGGPAVNGLGEIVAIHGLGGQAGCIGSSTTSTVTVETRTDDIRSWIADRRSVDTGVAMKAGTSPAIAVLPDGSYRTAYQAADGGLYVRHSSGTITNTGFGMAAGTSPAIAVLPDGSYEVVFQANTGTLYAWRNTVFAPVNTGLAMQPGTSPTIATLPTGAWRAAFHAANTNLATYDSTGAANNYPLGMKDATNPAITALTDGSYRIAFQANTGTLWTFNPAGASANTGLAMKPATSPTIATLPSGAWRIAFQADNGDLWTYHSSGSAVNIGLGMKDGTSPAIAVLPDGSYQIAFQSNTGTLYSWRSTVIPAVNTGLAMMAATSPAIAAASAGSHEIAFQAGPTGNLWTRLTSTAGIDLGLA